jgi:acylglycerol lipase
MNLKIRQLAFRKETTQVKKTFFFSYPCCLEHSVQPDSKPFENHTMTEEIMEMKKEESNLVSIRGTQCFIHRWEAADASSPKALIVLYHGFGAHGAYPTVRYAAEFFSQAGYAVVAFDFPGHGRSEGIPGYLKSSDDLIEDGITMAEHAQSLYGRSSSSNNSLPLVLCGSSMGGAIALLVAHRLGKTSGNAIPLVILMAPMLKLNVSSLEHNALHLLNYVAPTARLIPSSATDGSKQYRDDKKRKECDNDSLCGTSGAYLRVGSALACVDTAFNVAQVFESITNPYLLLIADEDVVVKNEGAEDFHRKSTSKDKTKMHYPALHGLLCEPSPLFETIKADALDWLEKRI